MKFINSLKSAATVKLGRTALKLQKHSPVILFAVGVTGMVGTVILASRATLKLEETLEDTHKKMGQASALRQYRGDEYSEEDFRRDQILIYLKAVRSVGTLYAPAVLCGVVSIAALTGSHYILSSRNLAITAAYASVDKAYRAYQERVAAEFGEEKAREFRDEFSEYEVMEKTADDKEIAKKQRAITGRGAHSVLFDEACPAWSKEPSYNAIYLRGIQNYANDRLNLQGHLFVNDVLDMIGLQRTRDGAVVGWIKAKGNEPAKVVDFGIFSRDQHQGMLFVTGQERSIWLDFNVDGIIYDKI
jgi:hypothetical protein